MSDYLDPTNEELLKDYFSEADMQVDILEQNILVLENEPSNHDAIDEIFRAAHTLKGASATVQMNELAEFTHIVEDVFDEIRSGTISLSSDMVDTVLSSVDIIKEMLSARKKGDVFDGSTDEVASALRGLLSAGARGQALGVRTAGEPEARPAEPKVAPAADDGGSMSEYELLELREAAGPGRKILRVSVDFDESNPMNTVGGIQVFAALKAVGSVLKTVPDFDDLYEDTYYPTVLYYVAGDADEDDVRKATEIPDVTLGARIEVVGAGSPAPERKIPEPADKGRHGEVRPAGEAAPAVSTASNGNNRRGAPHSTAPTGSDKDAGASLAEPSSDKVESAPEHRKSSGSVLRVDSRRIDDLLNLVSETVINKAGFNQVNNHLTEAMGLLGAAENEYRESLKALFDSLPEYLEKIQGGASIKEVRREISSRFAKMYNIFDGFEGVLKGGVAKFRSTAQNLGRITGELQEGVMRIRMVPISQIFKSFPRLVRDVSRSLKRKVNLEIEGEDTELDKSVIEDLLDPLIHCVRNSIDHGIEDPAERREAGKEEYGTVRLKASNEGNMILIEVSDDGRGIDVAAIRAKAVERGVIHPSKALSDIEAFNLIFDAGFSTAKKVTSISGRGVGLDVVKKQIEKLNGNVTVWSEKGMGTKFTIKIPLTLAIIQGLLVRVGTETYAIPITSVMDSHRIRPSEIKMIDNYEVFNVREDVVSLLRLNRLFKINSDENREYYFVVIVGSADKKMGLIVDQLIGEEDVVIKPLRDHYTNAPGIAGANITGDGSVSLIIDVSQLLDLGLRRERELRKKRETTIR